MNNVWAVAAPIRTPTCPLTVSASTKPSQTPKEKRKLPELEPQTQTKETHKAQTTNKQQLSGLDVLWAMQQAAAAQKTNKPTIKRKNKKVKGRPLSSAGGRREEDEEDVATEFGDVRPLCIKKEWADKFVDFEKRLRELSPSSSRNI